MIIKTCHDDLLLFEKDHSGKPIPDSYFVIPKREHDKWLKTFEVNNLTEVTLAQINRQKAIIELESIAERKDLMAQGLLKQVGLPDWLKVQKKTFPTRGDEVERFNSCVAQEGLDFKVHSIPEEVIENTRQLAKRKEGNYVYHLRHADEETFYVGYTSKPLVRWSWHMIDSFAWTEPSTTCTAARVINETVKKNEWFFMQVVSAHSTREEAEEEERREIRRLGTGLTNRKDNPHRITREQRKWNRYLTSYR